MHLRGGKDEEDMKMKLEMGDGRRLEDEEAEDEGRLGSWGEDPNP